MENRQDASISFYVAGCMEYEHFAELYENLTLVQAVDTFVRIRKRNERNIPGIGFVLKDPALPDYSDIHWPLFQGGHLSKEEIDIIPAYAEHPLVQQAVKEVEQNYLPKLEKRQRSRYQIER